MDYHSPLNHTGGNTMLLKAVIHGAVWSVLFVLGLILLSKYYPHTLVHNYPKELQKLAKVPIKGTKKGVFLLSSIIWIFILGYYFFAVLLVFKNNNTQYIDVLIFSFVFFMMWNIFDLLVVDWIIFCTIQPPFMILEGTKGHPEYKNYKFHFIGFLKGIIIMSIGTILFGSLAYLILKFIIW
jgi:hypothetical protein